MISTDFGQAPSPAIQDAPARAPLLAALHTPRDLLRYAVSRFSEAKLCFGQGSTNAFDEAAYLILHTLHLPLDQLEPFLDAQLLPEEVTRVLDVIDQRSIKRLPAAYITGEAWLGHYRFYVDKRVIVPRSFIAELIPEHFSPWVQDPEGVHAILDLCTGSACLPIMFADAFPDAQIDAIDISKEALEVAKRNVADYGLNERIALIESDLYTQIPAAKKYDLIISNPPYVNEQSMHTLPAEFLHEPQNALHGGVDGMDMVRGIIAGAVHHLNPEGLLIIEIGHERANVEPAFPHLEPTWITTSNGDDMVFLLTAQQLIEAQQKG